MRWKAPRSERKRVGLALPDVTFSMMRAFTSCQIKVLPYLPHDADIVVSFARWTCGDTLTQRRYQVQWLNASQ